MTPAEVASLRPEGGEADGPGWQLRVVPNKFPAVSAGGRVVNPEDVESGQIEAAGRHEVVIESPRHGALLGEFSVVKMASILRMWRDRMADMLRDPAIRYVQLFRNHGPLAGASLEHPHAQIIGLPIVPERVASLYARARARYALDGRSVFSELLGGGPGPASYVVFENAGFAALVPWAARMPFETWVLPKTDEGDFTAMADSELDGAAEALLQAVRAIEKTLGRPDYNVVLHADAGGSGEPPAAASRFYRWHICILPRLAYLAGFELATGTFINPVAPEQAAERLALALAEQPRSSRSRSESGEDAAGRPRAKGEGL